MTNKHKRTFFTHDPQKVIQEIGKEGLILALQKMLLIRNLEIRGEAAYQQGKVGGFYHAYIGQEAIQTACVDVVGQKNWFITSYRCHALALLLGVTPKEIMAEFYGRSTGNAKGRGGSMHLYADRLLGGFGIVTGQVPIATGAAFTVKYLGNAGEVAVCFLGDGALAQGSFHEALNMASLWNLPCIYVIENNQWGMGTAVEKAIAAERLAEDIAPAYKMKGYTFNGMDYLNCYAGFKYVHQEVLTSQRPVLIEAVSERFRGHSISDPGLYRSKEDLQEKMLSDPIVLLRRELERMGYLDEATFKEMDKKARERCIEAMSYAEESPWPDPSTLEEGVYV